MSSVEFTLTYSFLAASGSGPVLTAALEFGAIYRIRTDECQVGNLMPYHLANIALLEVTCSGFYGAYNVNQYPIDST